MGAATQRNRQNRQVDDLVALMDAMAGGQSQALFDMLERYRSDLTRTVRWILSDLGRSDAAASPEDLDFLVQTAAIVVFDRASGWRPGGAAPWVWATRSIRAEIVRWLGHPRVEFDGRVHEAPERGRPVGGRSCQVDLHDLATRDPRVASWLHAVKRAANERDQAVHLEYQTQKHLGDRSPANTVAAMFGLSPANVRQIDTRVRRRMGRWGQPGPTNAGRRDCRD